MLASGISDACMLYQTIADENGYFEHSFSLNEGYPSGRYWVYSWDGEELKRAYYIYSSVHDDSAADVLAVFNSSSVSYTDIEAYQYDLGIDLGALPVTAEGSPTAYLRIMTEILELIISRRPSGGFKNISQINNAFGCAACVAMINQKYSCEDALTAFGEAFGIDAAELKNCPDTTFAEGIITKRTYSSTEDFVTAYKNALMLCDISYAGNAGRLMKLFTEAYPASLEISEATKTKYASLKDKLAVFAKMRTSQIKYETVSSLISAYISAVDSCYRGENASSGVGSPQGGGGAYSTIEAPVSAGTSAPPAQAPTELPFSDLDEALWAQESILSLYRRGIVAGDGSGRFRPNDGLTREEFVKMVVTAFGFEPVEGDSVFEDVSQEHWNCKYILSAYRNNIVRGVEESQFGLGRQIKRQEIAAVIYRVLEIRGIATIGGNAAEKIFHDYYEIDDYAKEAINFMYANKIINGLTETKFAPKDPATRAHCAKILDGILQYSEKE